MRNSRLPIRWLLLSLCLFASHARPASAQARRTENVILVTLDGFRWQDLFSGADSALIHDQEYVKDSTVTRSRFWRPTPAARRETLLPFLWSTIAREGQLYGNRNLGSRVNVTNEHRFSYPGYNEILTGFADPRIDSNDKNPNPNRTVLEFAQLQAGFRGRVAVFGSWDVFPYIINEERSGVPVNAGFEPATGRKLTLRENFLNTLQAEVPSPWATVRLDAFTHHFALEYLQRRRPRLLYIAYGETDVFAHDEQYDAYLDSAQRTDGFLRELWTWVQSHDGYRGRTTLVVTTDHGRGAARKWSDHGADVPGAEEIWIAVLGPDSAPLSEAAATGEYGQNQIAGTVAALLGLRYTNERPVGAPLPAALRKR